MNQLNEIDWEEKTDVLKSLLGLHSIHSSPLLPGLEAEVIKYCTDDSCFVLKIWNKTSKPNIENQFRLLQTLYERGLPVPEACG